MAEEPFIEETAHQEDAEMVSPGRLWASVAFLAVGVAVLGTVSVFVAPMLSEGFLEHAPAKATVLGRDVQVFRSEEGERSATVFLVAWIDDRGRAQKGKLRTAWKTFPPGAEVEVRYALKPDGSAAEVWTREPDLVWLGPLTLFLAAGVTTTLLFAQTFGRAVRASRRPARTPDSGPSP